MGKKQVFFFVLIILFAVFFRFYKIVEMPGGLFPDEAANGLDINLMQEGQLQPFYERGNGREALFFYMLWGSVELFGKGPWQHHIVSALIGVLVVLITFFLTRRLFSIGGRNDLKNSSRAISIAALAAFFAAASSWHVVLSRTAFRANLIPLFAALTLYLLLCAYQAKSNKQKFWLAFLTGASFALGFYTYIAYRIMVPILGLLILWPWLASIKQAAFWQNAKKYFMPAVLFLLGFAIFIYPLFKYFYTHPGSFIGRSGQVSIFNPSLYTVDGVKYEGKPEMSVVLPVLGEVLKQSVLGYFTVGDLNWRHNVSGQPFLPGLVSPFFGIGLILATLMAAAYFFLPNKRAGWWKYFLLAGWFWGMLLPVITTAEGIPHGLRAIGTIPAVFIISAWVIYEFWQKVLELHNKIYEKWHGLKSVRYKIATMALKTLAVVFMGAIISQTYYLYFVYAYNSPENYYAFRSDLTPVSQYLKERCEKEKTYLVLDKFSVQTTDYFTSDRNGDFSHKCSIPYTQVDPENSWQLSNLMPGDEVVFTQSSIFDIKKFKAYHPEAGLKMEIRNKFGQTVMAVYGIND